MLAITLVAGRRPELLSRTLASFSDKLFKDNEIASVRVNIDPIFGDKEDETACVAIVREHFPQAEIRSPIASGFCSAVQWLWQGVPDGLVFHLEDDWICHEAIDTRIVASWMQTSVRSVPLLSVTHGKKGYKEYSESRTRKKFFGLKLGRRKLIPSFGTSPGFFDGAFLRRCAALLNEDLDPEKQMKPEINPDLFAEMAPYLVKFYKSASGEPIIEDIGREWRDARNIEKSVTPDGKSVWFSPKDGD